VIFLLDPVKVVVVMVVMVVMLMKVHTRLLEHQVIQDV
jgi:hypothetical protein